MKGKVCLDAGYEYVCGEKLFQVEMQPLPHPLGGLGLNLHKNLFPSTFWGNFLLSIAQQADWGSALWIEYIY